MSDTTSFGIPRLQMKRFKFLINVSALRSGKKNQDERFWNIHNSTTHLDPLNNFFRRAALSEQRSGKIDSSVEEGRVPFHKKLRQGAVGGMA